MGSKTPLLMITALVCGLGAAFGTWKLLSKEQGPLIEEKETVLVPKSEIRQYTLLNKDMFTTEQISKREIRDITVVVKDVEQIKDKSAKFTLRQGKAFHMDEVLEKDKNSVIGTLKPGEVAKTVKVNVANTGFFVQVGDKVDVQAKIVPEGEQQPIVKYILSDIQVIGINNQDIRTNTGDKIPPDTFTLRVTRAQANILTAYENSLSFVQRSESDKFDALTEVEYRLGDKRGAAVKGLPEEQQAKVEEKKEPEKKVEPEHKPETVTPDTKYFSVEITTKQTKIHEMVIQENGQSKKVKFEETLVNLPPIVEVKTMSEDELKDYQEKMKSNDKVTVKVLGEEKGPKPADKTEKVGKTDSN